ncbi:hypothetical protein [Rhodococcus sp. PvR099]|uniref:hypothetical protein n=1 Tax=Rhodococcus sp. PvR099 TaxID=2806602 RepID=UPI001AE347C7|nr:hypothetical protein [Rhodococcus sp. PvR099]MBP1160276.1 hypothetical protein [Rhodococcus sp. PvR099]
MPRPMMRRLAATVVASAVLAGGLAAGAGAACAVPANSLPGGSLADVTGSSDLEIPSPFGEILNAVGRFVAMDILGSSEPGPKPGM